MAGWGVRISSNVVSLATNCFSWMLAHFPPTVGTYVVCGSSFLVDGNVKRYVDTQLRIFQRDLVRNQSRDSRAAMSEALANPGLAVNQLLKMKARGLITMEEFLELTAEAAGSHEERLITLDTRPANVDNMLNGGT